MKTASTLAATVATLIGIATALPAGAQTAAPARDYGPLTIQHVEARTVAQRLVNDTLAAHPRVIILAMHVTPPGKADNEIIASNIGRIGKKADPDDLHVIATGESKPEVAASGDRFEDELPLHDSRGAIIGALGVVFAYRDGDDKAALIREAEAIRDGIAKQLPTTAKLFEPVS